MKKNVYYTKETTHLSIHHHEINAITTKRVQSPNMPFDMNEKMR